MARSEARISVDIWDDRDFLALDELDQRMFLLLLSQRDLSHAGVLALRERRWARTARTATVSKVMDALKRLDDARFVIVDEDAEEVLIRSFIRRDKVYRQPNVLRAALDHLPLVSSARIREALVVELRRVQTLPDLGSQSTPIVAEMLAALQDPSGNPSPDPFSGGWRAPVEDADSTASEGKRDDSRPDPWDDEFSGPEPGTSDIAEERVNISAGRRGSSNPSREASADPSAGTPGERGVVTAVRSDSPSPFPLSPVQNLGAKSSRSTTEPKSKRGTRIPDDFALTPAMREWARINAAYTDVEHDTAQFINYWQARSKDATKLDWLKTWENWVRSESKKREDWVKPANASNVRHIDPIAAAARAARNPMLSATYASKVPPAS